MKQSLIRNIDVIRSPPADMASQTGMFSGS